MPTVFTTAAEVTAPATYKLKVKAAVQKATNREPFCYYSKFTFATGSPGPAFIPGTLKPAVAKEIAAKGKGPARGFFTYAADTGVSLVVTGGTVEPEMVAKALSSAGLSCKVTAEEGTTTDKELEGLSDASTVAKKKAEFGDKLNAHLASKTPEDREAHARTNLEMGERITNASKTGDQPHAHSMSAHGPGTDQVPRIVAGYRADQVADMTKDGSLPKAKVALTKDGATKSVPKFTQVGDDTSDVSSEFGSAVAMQAAVEEAFAQATLLQSRIAAEVKATADDRSVLAVKEVSDALKTLVDARKAYDVAKAQLGDASKKNGNLKEALAKVAGLKETLEGAIKAFQGAKKVAMDARPKEVQSKATEGRMGVTVEPGMAMGTSYQTTAAKLPAQDKDNPGVVRPLTEATMKERYDKMTTTKDVPTAKVILDPAFVTDKQGNKRRAGWQAQTAFPTVPDPSDPAQRNISEGQFAVLREKEKIATVEADVAKLDTARQDLTAKEKADLAARKEAEGIMADARKPIDEVPEGDPSVTEEMKQAAVAAEAKVKEAKDKLAATRDELKEKTDQWNAAKKTRGEAQAKVVEAAEKVVTEAKAELQKVGKAYLAFQKEEKIAQEACDKDPSEANQKALDVAKAKTARTFAAGKAAKAAVATAEAARDAEKKKVPK